MSGMKKRTTVYVDEEVYQRLRVALVMDDLSFSEWVEENARRYVQARLRGTLTLLPDPAGTNGVGLHP
jgi:predicted CopG family antitoxin